jgi:3-hydroxy-9,10-secoandrosta-1,3,5(10)-triene-9,17-dione monooxygenase reductase component
MTELDPGRPDQLKATMSHFCTGVVAVTAIEGGEPIGFTCQTFASLSLAPPLIVIAPARISTTFPRIRAAKRFAVNVLDETQEHLARRLALSGADKFAGVRWRPGACGAPILAGALAWLECELVAEHDAGDHTLVVARVYCIGHTDGGRPLTFYRGRFARLEPREVAA